MTRKTRLQVESLDGRVLPSFSPATSYATASNPRAVATADFNNDGHLDLATAYGNSLGRVSIRLGDGAGGFGMAQVLTLSEWMYPSSVAVADFNEDGNSDLVVGGLNSHAILTGNGDGTFQPAVINPWEGSQVVVGDFNNDGHADYLSTYYAADWMPQYNVYLGNGQGDFWEDAYNGLQAFGVAVVDLNNDGNIDLAISTGNTQLGDGTGWFAYDNDQQALVNEGTIAAGDFDGDGYADLVSVSDRVAVLRGRGDGGFHPPVFHSTTGTVHFAVATGDFDGDGNLDAVVADSDAGTVSMMLGNGDGTLDFAGAFATGATPTAIAVGDFNGDGRPDAAVANADSSTVAVLLNDGGPWPVTAALRIGDVTVAEGNTGNRTATFTVTRTGAATGTTSVAFATANGTATAGSDYQATSGTLTFAPGETTKTITVLITGDRLPEPSETFAVNLTGPTNATIADGQGVGTITDDEPRISIGDVTRAEGKKNQTTLFTFTVTLSVAYDQPVTMSFQTVNGTAQSGEDYVVKSGTLTFAPGETTKTIIMEVKGDNKREADEYFYLDLFGLSGNGLFTKSRGTGWILNDD